MLTAPVYNYRNVEGAQPGYPEGWRPGDALDENLSPVNIPLMVRMVGEQP